MNLRASLRCACCDRPAAVARWTSVFVRQDEEFRKEDTCLQAAPKAKQAQWGVALTPLRTMVQQPPPASISRRRYHEPQWFR